MDESIKSDKSYNTVLSGVGCCAPTTISFHYVEYMESRALFATREALLHDPTLSDHKLKALMIAEWPQKSHEIGGYSRRLPNEHDEEQWKSLLDVMRKISLQDTQHIC